MHFSTWLKPFLFTERAPAANLNGHERPSAHAGFGEARGKELREGSWPRQHACDNWVAKQIDIPFT